MENRESTLTAVSRETHRVRSVYSQRKEPGGHIDLYARCAMHEREEAIVRHLVGEGLHSLEGLRILEVGCGAGALLRRLFDLGAEPAKCVGVDLRSRSLHLGKSLSPSSLNLIECTGAQLPFRDGEFDLLLQFTVFTSVLDRGVKRAIAREMLRTLRRGGRLVWYDFAYSNPQNANVKGIRRREVESLLSGCKLKFERITLAPPLGRGAARISPLLYHLLALVPLLRTHCLCFAQKL